MEGEEVKRFENLSFFFSENFPILFFLVPFTKIKWPKNREDISQPFIEYFFTTHSILLGKIKSFIMIFFLDLFFSYLLKKFDSNFSTRLVFHSALFLMHT